MNGTVHTHATHTHTHTRARARAQLYTGPHIHQMRTCMGTWAYIVCNVKERVNNGGDIFSAMNGVADGGVVVHDLASFKLG